MAELQKDIAGGNQWLPSTTVANKLATVLAGARQRLLNLQRILGAARVDLELPEAGNNDLDLMRQFVGGNVA